MTRWIWLSVPFTVVGEDIAEHAFSVLDQLFEIDDIKDPDVYVDAGEGKVTIELFVSGEDQVAALRNGFVAMRTAIHAAGAITHGWDEEVNAFFEELTLFPRATPISEWAPQEVTFSAA